MVKWPKRALLGASSVGVVIIVGAAGTSCVVYTPELLHEDAVSLGRSTPTYTSSPASPGPLSLRTRPLENEAAPTPELAYVVLQGPTPSARTAVETEQDHQAELDPTTAEDGGASDAGPDAN